MSLSCLSFYLFSVSFVTFSSNYLNIHHTAPFLCLLSPLCLFLLPSCSLVSCCLISNCFIFFFAGMKNRTDTFLCDILVFSLSIFFLHHSFYVLVGVEMEIINCSLHRSFCWLKLSYNFLSSFSWSCDFLV